MIDKFCKSQIKCQEDTDDTWTCVAQLHHGVAFKCPFSLEDIKIIDNKKYMTKIDILKGCCQDWEEEKVI